MAKNYTAPHFDWYGRNGFCLGRNTAERWFMSVGRRMRGVPVTFEWHNYPPDRWPDYGSDVLYVHVGISHPDRHAWWSFDITVWPPEHKWYSNWLRRHVPPYVYRYGWNKPRKGR